MVTDLWPKSKSTLGVNEMEILGKTCSFAW